MRCGRRVRDVSRTAPGTKAAASLSALATKMSVRMAPKVTWKAIIVYARLRRELVVRVVLSPMMSHDVLGRLSLRTFTMMPM
jgi:hypothetical protein